MFSLLLDCVVAGDDRDMVGEKHVFILDCLLLI